MDSVQAKALMEQALRMASIGRRAGSVFHNESGTTVPRTAQRRLLRIEHQAACREVGSGAFGVVSELVDPASCFPGRALPRCPAAPVVELGPKGGPQGLLHLVTAHAGVYTTPMEHTRPLPRKSLSSTSRLIHCPRSACNPHITAQAQRRDVNSAVVGEPRGLCLRGKLHRGHF